MTTTTLDQYANLDSYLPEQPTNPARCHCGLPATAVVLGYDRCTFAQSVCRRHLDEIRGFQMWERNVSHQVR